MLAITFVKENIVRVSINAKDHDCHKIDDLSCRISDIGCYFVVCLWIICFCLRINVNFDLIENFFLSVLDQYLFISLKVGLLLMCWFLVDLSSIQEDVMASVVMTCLISYSAYFKETDDKALNV